MCKVVKSFCPHCCNVSPQKFLYKHTYGCVVYDTDGKRIDDEPLCTYDIYTCETCDELLLYHSFNDDEPSLLYPKNEELDNSVPDNIAVCYAEARQIQNRAPNAYAIMIRKALEAICDDRKIKKGSLFQRLKSLSEKGEIPPNLIKASQVLRELGNAATHNTKLCITVPLTWGMDEFFRAIVEYVYIAPSKLQAFTESLNQIKKKK